MSLSEKDEKYRQQQIKKTVSIWGNKEDIAALKEVIDEIDRMFNVDLRKNNDLTSRITISEKVDPEAVMYPRTAQLLREMSSKFKDAATRTIEGKPLVAMSVSADKLPLLQKQGTRGEQIIGIMDNILHGNLKNRGNIPTQLLRGMSTNYINIIDELDGVIQNPELNNVLKDADLQWTYVQRLDTHMGAHMTDRQKLSVKTMLKADKLYKDYPSDVGGYSQSYVAMLRSDHQIALNAPTQIKKAEWDTLLRDYGIAGSQLDYQFRKPPKTMGDLMKFIFAYTVGTAFKMEKAITAPIAKNRESIEREPIKGTGEIDPSTGKLEVKGFRHLYKGIVLGTGPIRVRPNARDANISNLSVTEVPAYFI